MGGDFSNVGGRSRIGFAALDDTVGAATEWDPGANQIVWSLAVSGTTLYAGGWFKGIGGVAASSLAAISSSELALPPTSLALAQSAPNPARSTAIVHYALPSALPVTLSVFDIQGRRIATLLDHQLQPAGDHDVLLQADRWRPGVYFYRLEAAGKVATRRMIVVR
ncbi:MAG: hypothetical protein DMD82_06660 [Candidatus Rokuibacteriota bacterium]|nr:MAG: hypothetical protein DMD82_06660 [Candidatus Rokubacteria bacterium]